MSTKKILVLGLLISAGFTLQAFADTGHKKNDKSEAATTTDSPMANASKMGHSQMGSNSDMGGMDMMNGDMMPMMKQMMQMHMKGKMGGGMDHMGGGANRSIDMMGMMDSDMMGMMRQKAGMDGSMDLDAKLKEFDADKDGNLNLEEFEALHKSAMQSRMVDRFQHLDANGDGQVSSGEMMAAGGRMAKMSNGAGMDSTTKEHHGDDKK